MTSDRFEDAADGVEGSALVQAERILAALRALQRSGYVLVLLPEASVRVRRPRRRKWRRRIERRST